MSYLPPYKTFYLSEIQSIADELAAICKHRKKIAFLGELGAGKTTLIQALCRALGSTEDAMSPSFAIINEYVIAHDYEPGRIWHIDLYRVKSIEEALDFGIEEYLDDPNYCMIEWPGLIRDLMPPETVWVQLEHVTQNKRKITITNAGERKIETNESRF